MENTEFTPAFDAQRVTNEVAQEIERLATLSNKEYFEKMDQARKVIANQKVAEWMKEHPFNAAEHKSEKEYYRLAVKVGEEVLKDMPTYLETELRTLVQWKSSIFTLGANILNEIVDFKNLYSAVNEAKLKKYVADHSPKKEGN